MHSIQTEARAIISGVTFNLPKIVYYTAFVGTRRHRVPHPRGGYAQGASLWPAASAQRARPRPPWEGHLSAVGVRDLSIAARLPLRVA